MGILLAKTRQFIADTIEEVQKCHWPNREELFESTKVVIFVILALSLFIVLVDMLCQNVIRWLTAF